MSDAIISRRGGNVLQQAIAPTITKVSETTSEITFTITNNDTSTAVILWEIGDDTPDENTIELATGATSGNITVSSLNRSSIVIVYATANVTGKIKSNVVEIQYDALVFTVATGGTTEEYDLDGKRYKSHTFTSNGTFEVTTVGDADGDRNEIDYLIIAGGGGGGCASSGINSAGGGGAGGYLTTLGDTAEDVAPNSKVTVTQTTYSITIGAAGPGSTSSSTAGGVGGNSSIAFPSVITADGGGGGKSQNTGNSSGGSGGGGTTGATGISGQGRNGGGGVTSGNGGGGGAGGIGVTGISNTGGNGGQGLDNILRIGSAEGRAGGGGGGGPTTRGIGTDGGGNGGQGNGSGAGGVAGTGGGGGGGSRQNNLTGNGGSGGAGVVIIRYEIPASV